MRDLVKEHPTMVGVGNQRKYEAENGAPEVRVVVHIIAAPP